jgi:hypothetical protein
MRITFIKKLARRPLQAVSGPKGEHHEQYYQLSPSYA